MLSYMVRNHYKTISKWTSMSQFSKSLKLNTIMEKMNVRWAFNTSLWKPTLEEITAASSFIQKEEIDRLSKFYFQRDAQSSLIGRLMMRKYVHLVTSIPYNEVRFIRDHRGKPYLVGAGDMALDFNVSHQGDFVVMAGTMNKDIGIDVMKLEPPVNKDVPDFLRLMKRQFSKHEWTTLRSYPTELEQMGCFYRIWCLKESYLKNLACGVTVPLNDISFSIKTPKLKQGVATLDTLLYTNGELQKDWIFEETMLDDTHAVAVCVKCEDKANYVSIPYKFLRFEELVKEARPLHEPDCTFSNEFMKKQLKPF